MPWLRVFKWLVFTVVFSLLPIGLHAFMYWAREGGISLMEMTNNGELFIISCGLAAASISEALPSRGRRMSSADILFFCVLLLTVVISTTLYGAVVAEAANKYNVADGEGGFSPERVSLFSLAVFTLSLFTSLTSIVVSKWGDEDG